MAQLRSLLPAILLLAAGAPGAVAQMQSITTYGGGAGMQTTTIYPTCGGGYNYTTIGGPNSGSWGGVIAQPGTSVSAALTPRGEVVPIVNAVPRRTVAQEIDEQNAAINAQIAAQNAAIMAQPLPEIAGPAARTRGPDPGVPTGKPYRQYQQLYKSFTPAAQAQIRRDWIRDSTYGGDAMVDPRSILAYTRAWLRLHPEAVQPPAK